MSFKPSNPTNHVHDARSLNNRVFVEAYQKGELRSKEKNGFAFVDQKTTLKGLKVLLEARLNDGTMVLKNSIAYIKEESLHTQAWAQKPLECDVIGQLFIIVDAIHIEFIVPPKETVGAP